MRTATQASAHADDVSHQDASQAFSRGSGRRLKAAPAQPEELARAMTDALEHILAYEERRSA